MLPKPWMSKSGRALAAVLLAAGLCACGDGTGPGRIESKITGYMASGQANGTDPATGEQLSCVFLMDVLSTGGPLKGSWTGTTRIIVFRAREGESQRVTYDTTIATQEVTLTLLDNGRFQLAAAGPFADTMVADVDTAYPGSSFGEWSCGPEHPLARVQEGVVLTGHWGTQPELPIE
ncbi:MAG TPA: hypothetical protein VMY76_03150 [Gemmatimonadales bacterium]|nr:hypothetical protein [Gemmatimonadales bacterium]